MFQFTELPPLALYIHFPWCIRKCPYCDFNSHEAKQPVPQAEYINALLSDLEQELPDIWGRSISSVFMGGGTPSLFDPAPLDTLLSGLRARLNLAPDIEITLEANPGTIEQARFNEYRALGINRLSIGIQSFRDEHLARLGRIHSAREAIRAVETAHKAGFDNFNLDLMYGLPDQTVQQALADVANAIDLEPTHISFYQLTLEPNTLFYRKPPVLPEEDTIAQIEQQCRDRLQLAGYARYETSAYARPGRQCLHNLNYWQFGDYLGIGAGAHGKLTRVQEQAVSRSWKVKNPRDYLQQADQVARIGGSTSPDEAEVCFEFMLNALRLSNGFDSRLFAQRCGQPITRVERALTDAQERGLLEWTVDRIRPTEQGQTFLNDLTALFLPEPVHAG